VLLRILVVNGAALAAEFGGVLRLQHVRATQADQVCGWGWEKGGGRGGWEGLIPWSSMFLVLSSMPCTACHLLPLCPDNSSISTRQRVPCDLSIQQQKQRRR
jgi:hypothetical protein